MPLHRSRTPAPHRPRHDVEYAVPGYGVGYNPAWPSILSVAHDEANGGRLLVITDRPCVLSPPANSTRLPLAVAGLSVLDAVEILPVKFRLEMSGAVPPGAAWTWGANAAGLYDPITTNRLNAASGNCADVPGPYAPTPATVTGAFISGGYMVCNLVFDRPIALAGSPPYDFADGAIQFNDQNPVSVSIIGGAGGTTLACTVPGGVGPGGTWNVNAQPTWLATPVAVPQSGNFE